MWIIPTNYPQSSVSAPDMVASSEDLALLGLNIEQSLMWRSKPSQLRTWLQRWKRDSWFQHLSGRILKPCQRSAFESELMSSLAVIPASHLVQQGSAKAQKTQDTSGPLLSDTSRQLDLFAASLRTSKDTLALDSEKSLKTWKSLVTRLRGEYLARLKSERLIRESGSTSWPTPTAQDNNQVKGNPQHPKRGTTLGGAVRQWPTPAASQGGEGQFIHGLVTKDGKPAQQGERAYHPETGKHSQITLNRAVKMFPTPTVQDSDKATKKMREDHQNNLTAVVFDQASFPTPTARDYKGGYKEDALIRKDGKSRRFDALPNAAINGQGTDVIPGHLSADWVEGLMGLPAGWTDLGNWGSSE